ncbi:MAG TPA: hypothetical protein VIF83_04465 [Gemmatimonadaceae bacterium]|jgi:hypothetical protein
MQQQFVINVLEIVAPTAIAIVFIIAAGVFATSWIARRGKGGSPADPAAQARIEERLTHLTNAVEAMAVEIERISEGQRFTTRLLAENADSPPRLVAAKER